MIGNRVIILDVSFWQDDDNTPYKIDFKRAWASGADGAILRAGQNAWVDEDYLDYVRNATEANLPWGAYWFFDSRVSPTPQADLFADLIERSGFPPLGIWGDYEEHYNGMYGGEANFELFMKRLKERFPGKIVGIYTGPSYWLNNTTATGRMKFIDYPLWIANYGVSQPAIPEPWGVYTFWQFTDSGPGYIFGAESAEIDMNYFWGDINQYKNRFGLINYVPYGSNSNGDEMYKYAVKSTSTPHINLRAAADQYSQDLGDLYPGTEFLVDTIDNKDSMGRDWLHVVGPGMTGYVLASLCDYLGVVTEPTPEPTTHVLEIYIDGVLEYRKEF